MLALATFLFFSQIRQSHLVNVKTCDGKFANIFSDSAMTIRMANPLVPDHDGKFQFYTPDKCVRVTEN